MAIVRIPALWRKKIFELKNKSLQMINEQEILIDIF